MAAPGGAAILVLIALIIPLSFQQKNRLNSYIESYYLGVAIDSRVRNGIIKQSHKPHHIALVDIRAEARAELTFVCAEGRDLRSVGRIDIKNEIFTEQTRAITIEPH